MMGYLVLAEANICINSPKKAEHFLISASGSLIKFQDEASKIQDPQEKRDQEK